MKHVYRPFVFAASFLCFGIVWNVQAQPQPGNCEYGQANATLNANDVSAGMYTTGSLFARSAQKYAQYFVPKDDSVSAIYVSNLWVGGRVDDELRVAGTPYGFGNLGGEFFEFWPGPLEQDGTLPNPDNCSEWDRIWDVSHEDIDDYEDTGIPTDDLAEWPYDLGAPVIDGDGDPDNYDLEAGDRPELIGDQTLWWILNDVGNEHNSTLSDPIGMEVRVQAFSFATDDVLDRATFYKFTLTYKGTAPLDSTHFTLFADPDLGGAGDDLIGSDTTRSLGYVYNGDEEDWYYGSPPPALGYSILQGPLVPALGETWEDPNGTVYMDTTRIRMTAFAPLWDHLVPQTGYPYQAMDFWNYMRGRWRDGSPIRACGNGYGCDGPITTYLFHGEPITEEGWFMESSYASDQRFMVSTGPFDMQPGDEQEIVVAIVFGWGEDRLDSVTELRAASDLAQAYYEAGFPVADESEPGVPEVFRLSSRPNPADRSTALTFSLETPSEITLEVYDALGRRITAVEGRQVAAGLTEIALSTKRWPAGTYIVRLQGGERVDRHRFVVVH